MVNINWLGGAIFIINIILTFILTYMRHIGIKRGAAISGWVSFLLGALILVIQNKFTFITASVGLVMGVVAIFGILFVIIPALSPHANLGLLKYPIKGSMWMGFFIGYLMAAILAFL